MRMPLCLVLLGWFALTGLALGATPQESRRDIEAAQTEASRLQAMLKFGEDFTDSAPAEAIPVLREAAVLARKLGQRPAEAQSLLNLSIALSSTRDFETSFANAREARDLCREIGAKAGEATALFTMGTALLGRSRPREAIPLYEESLKLLDPAQDAAAIANTHSNLANCWLYLGDSAQAIAWQEKAIASYQRSANASGEALARNNLAAIYYGRGDYEQATAQFTDALRLGERTGNQVAVGQAERNLGLIARDQARSADAAAHFERAIALGRQLQDPLLLGGALIAYGAMRAQEKHPSARPLLEEGIRLATAVGDRRSAGNGAMHLGTVLLDADDVAGAVEQLRHAVALLEPTGDKTLTAGALERLGRTLLRQGQIDEARQMGERALALALETDAKMAISRARVSLSYIVEAAGDFRTALAQYRQGQQLGDEVVNEKVNRQIAETQTKYETEKKTREIETLQRDQRIQVLAAERQRWVRNTAIGGAALLFLLSAAALNGYRLKRRAARLLQEKNTSLGEANVVIAAEREKSERLLLSILPPSIAARLKENDATIAESFAQATVLFADIVGFTQLSQRISPEALVGLLDDIFTRFDALAARHGLEKIKTIGDCYMVVGGLPEPEPDHCFRIAQMALDLREALADFNRERGQDVAVRIGFHTGPVVAGVIGRRKFIYDLWGDTVNTASRMESSGQAGQIQVTEAVALALDGKFELTSRGEIEVKGKGRMRTFFLGAAQ